MPRCRGLFRFASFCPALLTLGAGWGFADTLQDRVDALPAAVAGLYQPDSCAGTETDLDREDFQEINKLNGPKLLSNAAGWEVIARTGGRPFGCFHNITVDGVAKPFMTSDFNLGSSSISQQTLDDHFSEGKQVNRLWFTHPASNGFPTVVVFTPDGFFNLGGAEAPILQGAAARFGLIGEPFTAQDFDGHADEVEITTVSNDVVEILYNYHSSAGEAALHAQVLWNPQLEKPEVKILSAVMVRSNARIGGGGLNFLRGPSLHGLDEPCFSAPQGIQSFHDARTGFLLHADGAVTRIPLVPPHGSGAILDDSFSAPAVPGDQLIIDQPQGMADYFSKTPGVLYQDRADFSLQLVSATHTSVVKKSQISVNFDFGNPNANPESMETANIFFASDIQTGEVARFEYQLKPHKLPFDKLACGLTAGLVFVSDLGQAPAKLAFLPLDAAFNPAGPARALTDEVIRDPRRPDAAVDGRAIVYDADAGRTNTRHRIHIFDRREESSQRVSTDPFAGNQTRDIAASLSPDAGLFAFATDRANLGTFLHSGLQDASSGLSCGLGSSVLAAADVDWSPSRDELATISGATLNLANPAGSVETLVLSQLKNPRSPDFSPSGDRIAFADDDGIHVTSRDGSDATTIHPQGDHPTWLTEDLLVIQRTVGSETDLFRISASDASVLVQLTPTDNVDAIEPTYARKPCGSGTALFQPAELGVFLDGAWFLDRNGDSSFDAATETFGWGPPGSIPVSGDWDGDGFGDLAAFVDGVWFIDFDGNGAFDPATEIKGWGAAGWTPLVGDWNGDGVTDLGVVTPDLIWFRDLDGDFLFDPSSEILGWGSNGDIPLVADWNGDGKSEVSVYSDGIWFVDLNGDGAFDPATEILGWGAADWTPVIGDWNADGSADLGVVAPNSTWFIDVNGDRSFDPATEVVGWGSPNDTPTPHDWNGDGRDELGVFSNGAWFLDLNGDYAFDPSKEITGWGSPGWTPTAGRWQ